jgi:hypothetical protein
MTAPTSDPKREMLRHTLATIAYRGGKAIRDAPEGFAAFRCGSSSRSAGEILAHIGDLLDWSLSIAKGKQSWKSSEPLPWESESARFFVALKNLDDYLASDEPLQVLAERLFQAPIADSLTHIGQIAMLRRMAGVPLKGENFFVAKIDIGRVGAEQIAPKTEFD